MGKGNKLIIFKISWQGRWYFHYAYIPRHTYGHEKAREHLSTWLTCRANLPPEKQFAAKFKSLLHLLGKSAKAAKLNQCPVTRLASGQAAKQVTSPPPALLHKHDPRALNSPGHGVLRELASVYLHSEIMYKRMWTLAGGTKNDLHEIAELNVSVKTSYTSECIRVEIVWILIRRRFIFRPRFTELWEHHPCN